MPTPPVCNYEDSDYQISFWDEGGREYEDRTEAIALKRLLPKSGRLLLELGAGAGRNTTRYPGFDRIVLLDYARTQLEQAQVLLGRQKWSPFTLEPVEFVELNFDFHPKAVRNWLRELGFETERTLTLSHFRVGLLKRIVPTGILV